MVSAKCSSMCSQAWWFVYTVRLVYLNVQLLGVQGMPWLTLQIINTCLTQLDREPPFQRGLHSQLWGAAHRGSHMHLQSWNGVWDLCSDYAGTSRVHILSHDSLCQNHSSLLLEWNIVTHGFKVRVHQKQSKSYIYGQEIYMSLTEAAQNVYLECSPY